jgi:transketolase
METQTLIKQIFDESYKRGIGHIGSCITMAPILNAIYSYKCKEDTVVLSAGHAGLALFLTLKGHNYPIDIDSKGTHPDYSPKEGIDASTGSLGHGIGISVGYALADRSKISYCVSSDGEVAEGSWWESLNIAINQKLSNLKVFINCNGYGAYDPVDTERIISKVVGWGAAAMVIDNESELLESLEESVPDLPLVVIVKSNSDFSDNTGLDAHYKPLTEDQYKRL